MFFKRKPKISEHIVMKLVQNLEATYMNKDIDKLTRYFHQDHRQISFLNHFTLMMNFQIYNISSQILNLEILDMNEEEATFSYTRKHMYTCVNEADENGTNPNNISSYLVEIKVEDKDIWIVKYARYSELFLDLDGTILPNEKAVVPPSAEYFQNLKRFIEIFRHDRFKPATYFTYSNSEFIGYYPEEERYAYRTTEKLTFDYFLEMDANSIEEHTKGIIEGNTLEDSDVLVLEQDFSILELRIQGTAGMQHELILSINAPDGFFMIRYLRNDDNPIDEDFRSWLLEKMKLATARIEV